MGRNVFVAGGWLPNGGALMAYEIGARLAHHHNTELHFIKMRNETSPSENFEYPCKAAQISMPEFFRRKNPVIF